MSPPPEKGSTSAAEALDVIADAAFRRRSLLQQIALRLGMKPWILFAMTLGIVAVLAVAAYLGVGWKRHEYPVAILLPSVECGDACTQQAVEKNCGKDLQLLVAAQPQVRGFEIAWADNGAGSLFPHWGCYQWPLRGPPDHPQSEFHPDNDQLLEELYDDGVRHFIVTMSDTVIKLMAPGGEWDEFSNRHLIDPPILIATVASAPLGDAIIERGVIRNYIRSDDEVNQFAAYLSSRELDPNKTEYFVLYVGDQYGDKAKDLIKEIIRPEPVDIEIPPSTTDFQPYLENLISEVDEGKHTIVILIGYGGMVKEMLDALNNGEEQYQNGEPERTRIDEVLVASTLTEKAWQPNFYAQDQNQIIPRISTLVPFGTGKDDCEGGAVCQFSYMTLRIVLNCKDRRGIENFFNCFVDDARSNAEENDYSNVELSTTGDSIVPLNVKVTVPQDRDTETTAATDDAVAAEPGILSLIEFDGPPLLPE